MFVRTEEDLSLNLVFKLNEWLLSSDNTVDIIELWTNDELSSNIFCPRYKKTVGLIYKSVGNGINIGSSIMCRLEVPVSCNNNKNRSRHNIDMR